MRRFLTLGLLPLLAFTTAGCSMSMGSFSASTPPPAIAAVPAPVAYGGFLDGPVGSKLSQADRDKALASEQDALASGQRRSWKGERGTFGFVEPAPSTAAASVVPVSVGSPAAIPPQALETACRAFTSTIFLGGRPQVGHGRGCQNLDGTFHIVS